MLLKIFRKSKQQSLNLHTISASWIFFSSSHSTTQPVFFLVEKFEKGPFHQFKHHRTFIWLFVLVLTSKHQTYQVTCEPLYPDGPTHSTAALLPGWRRAGLSNLGGSQNNKRLGVISNSQEMAKTRDQFRCKDLLFVQL